MATGDPSNASRKAQAEETRIGWKMAGIGMTATSEVVAGLLLGWVFDYWRGHGNTGVIVGAITGILVALWTLIQSTLKLNRYLDRAAPTKGRGTPLKPSSDAEPTDDWHSEHDDDWEKPSNRN